jgi:hypothetical protein
LYFRVLVQFEISLEIRSAVAREVTEPGAVSDLASAINLQMLPACMPKSALSGL